MRVSTPTLPLTISLAGALWTPRVASERAMIPHTCPDGGASTGSPEPAGGTRSWLIPDLNALAALYNIYCNCLQSGAAGGPGDFTLSVAESSPPMVVATAEPRVREWEPELARIIKREIKRVIAEEFDVTPRAIRFYEDVGLLEPTRAGRKRGRETYVQ